MYDDSGCKTRQCYIEDHILMLSAYTQPALHSHLALHILAATEGELNCNVAGESFRAGAVFIASDVMHTACAENGQILMFLFDETSKEANDISELYLCGRDYRIAEEALVRKLQAAWNGNLISYDEEVLNILGLPQNTKAGKDPRITESLQYIKNLATIDSDIIAKMSQNACLSESRYSHLFKENTGIALNRYLVLCKMRKTYEYYLQGYNITQACMSAGFDSPSHFASTCKRMFGISFSQFTKSI